MISSITKLLKFLEDPKHPCLGPNLWGLETIGLLYRERKSLKSRVKLLLFYTIIIFFFSQYIKCAIAFDLASLQLILQYMPFHLGFLKSCFFYKDHKQWEELINFVSTTELKQRSKKNLEIDAIMREYIERSRRVTYFFWILAFVSNIGIYTEPYLKNEIIENGTSTFYYMFDGYTPFAREPPGYYYSMLIQTIFGNMMSYYIITWDMLIVSLMIFFIGQLKLSTYYCINAIDPQNREVSQQNITECHQFHKTLVRHQQMLNKLISPVMFMYLIFVSISLGVCIKEIVEIENDFKTLLSACVFIQACLIQLLLFYWHSNEVTTESECVSYGTFQSKWHDADNNIQRQVLLLGYTTKKKLVFSAGPCNEMSLSTFISILRGTYSFFTLLRGTS